MKNLTMMLACVAFLGLAFTNPASMAVAFKVDVSASTVKWTGYKVTGKHFGKVKIKSGSLEMSKTKLVKAAFEMDMSSLTVEDIEGKMADNLKGHLMSDDFFSVEKNPTASFTSTKITAKDKAGNFSITGNLVIKGISKPITFDANVKPEAGKVMGMAKIKVDRTNYDIKFRSGKFFTDLGDKAIYDDFELEINLVAAK
jgi:polyisoprenoid-binding protein YceI